MLSGHARLAGVLGWPVAHSRSPRLHGFWLERHGIDGAYVPLPVRPERFAQVVRALADLGFRGANVTLPHKEAAFAVCDEVAPFAHRAGAVNTLVFHEDGRIEGSNTDGYGFLESIREEVPGWRADRGPAVLLGAGGSARAVAAALLDAGCPRVVLVNRTRARAEALARALGGPITVAERPPLAEAALLVNTTALGMQGQPTLELDLSPLPPGAVVADLVYVPLETRLVAAARARGDLAAVGGLGMLLHQARPGFARWFGVEPQVDAALRDFVAAGIPPR
ncbi:shikimate dehydrogenase [Caldovatus sp. SYSU G05006]|uniref:Shikimate dehydrogenase (NADP(+)) n=1 Tax=Caldovatus aquaticus TaxID=2865671 RepID=A0ABS7F6D9_9PROT|nr:shikimate dehydrogenase [Caldovatus aquaticus]